MASLAPVRGLGLLAMVVLLAWCLGGSDAKRTPKPKVNPDCDALNKALLDAYFRPDLGFSGFAFTRPVLVYKCSRTSVQFNQSFGGDLVNAQRLLRVHPRQRPSPRAARLCPP